MTELEKIEYTKSFIDKMAKGINPLNNMPISDGDLLKNDRISGCMFYVSDILRQVIENGGVKPIVKSKVKKRPFEITEEQLQGFKYSDTPIPISEITTRLKSLIDTDAIRPLSHVDFTRWLVEMGALREEITDEGKKRKVPTEMGEGLGMITEQRTSAYGTYLITLYKREAQQFLIENLDSVAAMKN